MGIQRIWWVETDVTAGQRHASEFQGRSGHPPCSRMIEDVTIEDVTEEFWIGFCRTTESVEHPHRPYVNVAGEKYSRCNECGKFLEKQRLGPSGSISMIVIPELAPRWIDNDMIDSPAMLSAYIEWAGSPQGQGPRGIGSRERGVAPAAPPPPALPPDALFLPRAPRRPPRVLP